MCYLLKCNCQFNPIITDAVLVNIWFDTFFYTDVDNLFKIYLLIHMQTQPCKHWIQHFCFLFYLVILSRLNVDRSGGAWCPKQQIAENVKEYIQINFTNVSVISGIATQGRYGNGRGQEYAEQFKLEYWQSELEIWHIYRQRDGNDVSTWWES